MNTTQHPVLVIGATGNVGRHVVSQLLDTGAAVRALARNPDGAGLPDTAEVVRGDLTEPDSLRPALIGVDTVFLVWPFFDTDDAPAVVALLASHARRVVYLSANGGVDFHLELERLIRSSGLVWTFLRPGGFATNTLMWAPQIRADGVVRWPYASATRSLIDERDIAAVAVVVLADERHHGATYVLTGPQGLTQVEQAHAIGAALGRPVSFEEISPEAARAQLLAQGWPAGFADGALRTWAGFAARPEEVTTTVREVTGVPARTFGEWALSRVADFR